MDINKRIFIKYYLISINKYQKSDRIHISNIFDDNNRLLVTVRKCFHKNSKTEMIYINKNKFNDWFIIKKRKLKIEKLKNNLKNN